jgi:hypothetical protein
VKTVTGAIAALTLGFASACRTAAFVRNGSPNPPAVVGALRQDSLDVLRAVAAEVAPRNHGVAVYPLFTRLTGEAVVGVTPTDSARQLRIAQAFAEALGARIANFARRPDSTRPGTTGTVGTVGIVAIVVGPDSAHLDLTFLPPSSEMQGQWWFTAYRYRYRRENGRWSFIRREWLGSS